MPSTRFRTVLAALLLTVLCASSLPAAETSRGSVETQTRFLEYDQASGSLVYEVSIRNVGRLPVSYIDLQSDPPSLEGTFSVDELSSGNWAHRRFSFELKKGQQIFQPRFHMAFTDYEGERIKSEEERSPLAANVDFSYCDLATGWVDMVFTLSNLGEEPILFLEMRSENPSLPQGVIEHESLSSGESMSWTLEFQLEPGDTFFNPTVYLSYHSFSVSGIRLKKKFFTFLQSDLQKVQDTLAAAAKQ